MKVSRGVVSPMARSSRIASTQAESVVETPRGIVKTPTKVTPGSRVSFARAAESGRSASRRKSRTSSKEPTKSPARNFIAELEQLSNKAYGLLNRSREISQNSKQRSFQRSEALLRRGFSPQPSLQRTVKRSSSSKMRNSSLNSTTKKKKLESQLPKPVPHAFIAHEPFADLTNSAIAPICEPLSSQKKRPPSFRHPPPPSQHQQSENMWETTTPNRLFASPSFSPPELSISAILRGLGLQSYQSQFARQAIEIEDFFLLCRQDLRELGLPIGARNRVLAFQAYFAKNSQLNLSQLQGQKAILNAILRDTYNLKGVLPSARSSSNHHHPEEEELLPLQPPQQESMEDLRREMLSPEERRFSSPPEMSTLDLESKKGGTTPALRPVPDQIVETEEREEESVHHPPDRTADFRLRVAELQHDCSSVPSERSSDSWDFMARRSETQKPSPNRRGLMTFGGNKYLTQKYARIRGSRPPSSQSTKERSSYFELSGQSPLRTVNVSQSESGGGGGGGERGRGEGLGLDSSAVRRQLRADRSRMNLEVKSIMAELQALTCGSSRNL